jgi:hypothetical protein
VSSWLGAREEEGIRQTSDAAGDGNAPLVVARWTRLKPSPLRARGLLAFGVRILVASPLKDDWDTRIGHPAPLPNRASGTSF